MDDNIYKIQIANSPKDKQLYTILKELECDKIVYKFLRRNIPSSDIFYFVATPRMIKYFNSIDKVNKELNESKVQIFTGKFEGEKGDEIKQITKSEKLKLVESLKIIFK